MCTTPVLSVMSAVPGYPVLARFPKNRKARLKLRFNFLFHYFLSGKRRITEGNYKSISIPVSREMTPSPVNTDPVVSNRRNRETRLSGCITPPVFRGRLAQQESACLTSGGSQVRILYRPPRRPIARGRSSAWSERWPVKPETAGSNPVGPAIDQSLTLIPAFHPRSES